jgi:hypothetical protein
MKGCKSIQEALRDDDIAHLTEQVEKLSAERSISTGTGSANIMSGHHNTINNQTDNSVHMTVMLAFGQEDMSHISQEYLQKCCSRPLIAALQKLVDKTHFSPEMPQNQTVRCKNRRDDILEVSDGKGKWKFADRDETLRKMIGRLFKIMLDYADDCDDDSLYDKIDGAFKKFAAEDGDDREFVAKVLRETLLTILNGQVERGVPAG